MRTTLAGLANRRDRWFPFAVSAIGLSVLPASSGCRHESKSDYKSVSTPAAVEIVTPKIRNIVRVVGQPSFVEAYERTSIYPKVTGYIEKWIVDIGDRVKKGTKLATLFVPELVEDYGTKKATVMLDEERIVLADKLVMVADANVRTAKAKLDESTSILGKYEAEVERWATEVKRLTVEVKRGVIDPQVLLESENQLKSNTAAREAAKATIRKSEAELLSMKAEWEKAKVDVDVAKAELTVAASEAKRLEAWVGYLTLSAPFDGVIVARNANTFDFVSPTKGDPSADLRAPYLSPSGNDAPIYVVDRTDLVRVFVDIPELDANGVHIGSKASVLIKAFRDRPIEGSVTRTSWALNVKSRTLRAEIDLSNENANLLPGMYAYAKVEIKHNDVRAIPTAAIAHSGDQTYCWLDNDGKGERAELRTGVSDGDWIEVTYIKREVGAQPKSAPDWKPIDGSERVLLGDLTILEEGTPVTVSPPTAPPAADPGK